MTIHPPTAITRPPTLKTRETVGGGAFAPPPGPLNQRKPQSRRRRANSAVTVSPPRDRMEAGSGTASTPTSNA